SDRQGFRSLSEHEECEQADAEACLCEEQHATDGEKQRPGDRPPPCRQEALRGHRTTSLPAATMATTATSAARVLASALRRHGSFCPDARRRPRRSDRTPWTASRAPAGTSGQGSADTTQSPAASQANPGRAQPPASRSVSVLMTPI